MTTRTLAIALGLLATPFGAQAQGVDFQGTATIGYFTSSGDLFDVSGVNLGLRSDILFTPNFHVGLDLDANWSEIDGLPAPLAIDLDATRFALEPTYRFGNGWEGGIYYQQADIDISVALIPGLAGTTELETYGLATAYETGAYRFGGYLGRSDTDPGLPAGFDIEDWGLNGAFALASGAQIYGQFARTTLETPAGDIDADLIALGGDYQLQNGLTLFGSIGQLDLSTPAAGVGADATQVAFGVSYDLSGGGFPAIASMEIAHTEVDLPIALPLSPDQTKLSVGLTFALGSGKASTVPLDSGNRIARGDIRSALVSGIGGLN